MAISSSVENQYLQFVAYQSVTTGAFATPESAVRLLTKAAIEKRPFRFPPFMHRRYVVAIGLGYWLLRWPNGGGGDLRVSKRVAGR